MTESPAFKFLRPRALLAGASELRSALEPIEKNSQIKVRKNKSAIQMGLKFKNLIRLGLRKFYNVFIL